MPFGPFALQWRAPSPNPPLPSSSSSSLPKGLSRTYIPTPSGPLELLVAIPNPSTPISSSQPPLFFAHGGFGCAEVWVPYMQFFAAKGIPCYAVSYRGHGNSWYPGFWQLYFTSRGTMAEDLVSGIREAERLEGERTGVDGVKVVLVAHSAGGALAQYVLSKGMVKVQGFSMLAAVPGFGSWSVYKFWSFTAPIHFPYRLFHPRYVLATTRQVHEAFFSLSTPTSIVQSLEKLLSPYESMLWPTQGLWKFVTGGDVLSSIVGWAPRTSPTDSRGVSSGVTDRMLILAAENDVLCTPSILLDAAGRYRSAFRESLRRGQLEGIDGNDSSAYKEVHDWDGIRYSVVPSVGHHLMNDVGWERGAEELLEWIRDL